MWPLFTLLACQEQSPQNEQSNIVRMETEKKESLLPFFAKSTETEDDFSVVFSPSVSTGPIFLSIDTSGINQQIANSFLFEEMRVALVEPLDKILSGDVVLRISAPQKLGTDKPVIALELSPTQFLQIAPQHNQAFQSAGIIEVFRALNAYRNIGGNTADIRIFHFWIAMDVGGCRLYPVQQDAFVPINAVDNCLEEQGKKNCLEKRNDGLIAIPRSCVSSSP